MIQLTRNTFILFLAILSFNFSCKKSTTGTQQVLVLYNSNSNEVDQHEELLVPYLEHFGIPYVAQDINRSRLLEITGEWSLIIISHMKFLDGANQESEQLKAFLKKEIQSGTGVVSFDEAIPYKPKSMANMSVGNDSVHFANEKHYITEWHKPGEKMRLFNALNIANNSYESGKNLINITGAPLLAVFEKEAGKVVQWTSLGWARPQILGPWAGLDDCLWRSMVWAAKKPFVMQSLPPLVTMRVDDVAGRGHLWNESAFYWVHIANKYGFKPWMSLFIYNVTPDGIQELRQIIKEGKGTASPHALGRPPRTADIDFYYYPDALEYRAKEYDEFIFYNHQERKNFSDDILQENLEAVDKWYDANAPLPISNYLVPHHGEIAIKALPHIKEKWGIEFLGIGLEPDLPWSDKTPWLQCGPFRINGIKGTIGLNPDLMGDRPEYYNGFVNFSGYEFFNSRVVVRDVTGYEWEPDNDVGATVDRAVEQLTRSLDGLGLATLFTHETDFIYLIKPKNWEEELKKINEALAGYEPWYMLTDDALRIVRAHTTSKIENFKHENNTITVDFTGSTDVETYFYIFQDEDNTIAHKIVAVPPFEGFFQLSSDIGPD